MPGYLMTNSLTGSLHVQREERITLVSSDTRMFHQDTYTKVKTATTEMVRASCAVRMRYTCSKNAQNGLINDTEGTKKTHKAVRQEHEEVRPLPF